MTESSTAIVERPDAPELTPYEVMERVITSGDLAGMGPKDRVAFYWRTCESLGLNPLTRPFEFINLNGKLTLYARKDATDQLREKRHISVVRLERERADDLMMVTAYGRDRNGREDSAIGAVSIAGLRGEALANAVMKAETKAKRRMTLSLAGLGFLDESEAAAGSAVEVDPSTGAITGEPARPATLLEAVQAQAAAMAEPAPAPTPASPVQAAEPEPVVEPMPTTPEPAAPDPSTAVTAPALITEAVVRELPEPAVGDSAVLAPLSEDEFRAIARRENVTKRAIRALALRLFPQNERIELEADPAKWGLSGTDWATMAVQMGLER